MKTRVLSALAAWAALPLAAQLVAPNVAGVTMGHVHLYVKSVDAQTRFWTDMFGGKLVTNEKLSMIQFPGVFIILREMEPSGPPAGSIVDHFGFVLKDLPASLAKWKANGLRVEQTGTNPNQSYVTAPDGIRVEVFGDPSLPVPVQMNHIHFFPPKPDIPAMQAWYAKIFGGIPGKRESVARPGNWIDCDDLPGVNLSIAASETRRAATAGRSIDHIGFEVTNLEEFAKKLAAQGIQLDQPVRSSPNSQHLKIAFLTDPWGTRIELTEGLAPPSH
ncbi:MAG TPA: VOC family protein [Bryobacteraceae bacterium]|nr:VOC family protein [Bryobacteraceae bacterium]